MKFTNGHWLLRPGVTMYPCVEVRDMEVTPTRITLYITPWKVTSRGQTLSGPLLTVEFTSPQEDVLQLTNTHFQGVAQKGPSFPIADSQSVLDVHEADGKIIIASGGLSAHIIKEPFQIEYHYKGKFLTASEPKQLAYMTTPEGPYMRERLAASVDECFYGMGERFTSFVKNGQVVDIWNEDGGTASEQAYKNVPFYVSNRGYGVFVNHPEHVSYEVCSEIVSKVQFSVPGETLRYMVIGGDSLIDVVSSYTAITGRPALPPAWSYGLWLSTSFTTDYNEETVTSFIDGMFDRNIPLSVFHFDCFWMKEYQWCNFEWDTDAFPDPEGMLQRLKNKGLKICLWINPYIGQRSPLFAEGAVKGYLIKTPNGGIWQWDLWQPGLGIVDFTNPEAVTWYQNHLRRLMAQGVDCFKTDFGERIPTDCVYHDGSDPFKMHNYYSYLFNKIVFEVVREVKGNDEAVLFARSATAGGQQFPVHWGGDCDSNYVAMAESLRGGLSLSLCGFGFWSHDIGGFENTATPDVYKRWVAFGLFSSHSRLHGSISYRVPWLFDEEAVDVLRFFTQQKCALMPYIFAQAIAAHTTGVPMMRPMILGWQNDMMCAYLDKQYMFGENLLVAPVFNEEGKTRTYLPMDVSGGMWTQWFTNARAEGEKFVDEKHDYFGLGLWVRPNSIIPVGHVDNTVVYDYAGNTTFHVFELSDEAEAVVYNSDAKEALKVRVQRNGDNITVTVSPGQKDFGLLFRNEKVTGINVEEVHQGTMVKIAANTKITELRYKRSCGNETYPVI